LSTFGSYKSDCFHLLPEAPPVELKVSCWYYEIKSMSVNTSNDGNFSTELWDVPLLAVNNVMVMVLSDSHNNCYIHGRTSEFNI
jgi:hypothetical protein